MKVVIMRTIKKDNDRTPCLMDEYRGQAECGGMYLQLLPPGRLRQEDVLEPRNLRSAWATWRDPISKTNK